MTHLDLNNFTWDRVARENVLFRCFFFPNVIRGFVRILTHRGLRMARKSLYLHSLIAPFWRCFRVRRVYVRLCALPRGSGQVCRLAVQREIKIQRVQSEFSSNVTIVFIFSSRSETWRKNKSQTLMKQSYARLHVASALFGFENWPALVS